MKKKKNGQLMDSANLFADQNFSVVLHSNHTYSQEWSTLVFRKGLPINRGLSFVLDRICRYDFGEGPHMRSLLKSEVFWPYAVDKTFKIQLLTYLLCIRVQVFNYSACCFSRNVHAESCFSQHVHVMQSPLLASMYMQSPLLARMYTQSPV